MRVLAVRVLMITALSAAAASTAAADAVTAWNIEALNAIRVERTPPPIASRALAIIHLAIYDAVNGIERTHAPYRVASDGPASASPAAAAIVAAQRTFSALFPSRLAAADALSAALLASIADGPQKQAGMAWGDSVARQILASRAGDGLDALLAPPIRSGPGAWQPTPPGLVPYLLPQWAIVTPFAMPVSSSNRPAGPPALDSARYAREYNEVKALGAAIGSTRTPEQDLIALFWADGAGTETPPGHWNTIARDVAGRAGQTLAEDARLFALLNVAMADAAICAWDAKYAYDFWRPVTAIRNGDTDGNPATAGDPAWSSFIDTPPFPDYVSGHSTFSGAAATVLAAFYGTDDIAFTTGSDFLPGVQRTFASFSAAAREAALSRLYGGIHFRSANEDGMAAGVSIGTFVFERLLLPKGNRSRH